MNERQREKPSSHYRRLLIAAIKKHGHYFRRPAQALTVAYFRWAIYCSKCGPAWARELQRELRREERYLLSDRFEVPHVQPADPAYRSLRTSNSFKERLRLLREHEELRRSLPKWPEIPPDDWPHWQNDEIKTHLVGVKEPMPEWLLERRLKELDFGTHSVRPAIASVIVDTAARTLRKERPLSSPSPKKIFRRIIGV